MTQENNISQSEYTRLKIEFWESRIQHYMGIGDTKGAERCNKHVCELRNGFV